MIKEIKLIVSEIGPRWKAELNKFWKAILNLSLKLGVSAGGFMAVDSMFNLRSLGVSPICFTVAGYILAIAGSFGLAAKLSKP